MIVHCTLSHTHTQFTLIVKGVNPIEKQHWTTFVDIDERPVNQDTQSIFKI